MVDDHSLNNFLTKKIALPIESASTFVSTEFSYGTTSFLEVKDDKTSPNL